MCIFTAPAEPSKTRIYARKEGAKQFLAYQMRAESEASHLAMILPIPGEAKSVELIDMTEHADFFDELAGFMPSEPVGRGIGKEVEPPLEVVRCGSFEVSLVDEIEDFYRLSPGFRVSADDLAKLLEEYETKKYGFVVARLVPGELHHPLAFSFESFEPRVYLPLKHFHGHAESSAQFDHDIFTQYVARTPHNTGTVPGWYNSNGVAVSGVLQRIKIQWTRPNRDEFWVGRTSPNRQRPDGRT